MEHPPDGCSWLSSVGFCMLTVNSARAIYNSHGDVGSISFVLISYVDLLLLFWVLRLFENAAPNAPSREKIPVVVWLLSTLLTVMFTWKVASMMPLLLGSFVWFLASASSLAGFYALVLQQRQY